MSSEKNLKKLFQNWNLLNDKVQGLFGLFDFSKIKPIRKIFYMELLNNVPEEYRKIISAGYLMLLFSFLNLVVNLIMRTCGTIVSALLSIVSLLFEVLMVIVLTYFFIKTIPLIDKFMKHQLEKSVMNHYLIIIALFLIIDQISNSLIH